MNTDKKVMLIVDDMELNRAILNELFCQDYVVLEAENGKEALSLLERYKEQVSVILLDILMPVMNGFEVLFKMSEEGLAEKIPVILITSEDRGEMIAKGFRLGAFEVITKPFYPDIVRKRVKNAEALYEKNEDGDRRLGYDKVEAAELPTVKERTLLLLEQERQKYRILAELSGEVIFSYDAAKDFMQFSGKKINQFACGKFIENYSEYFGDVNPVHIDDRDKVNILEDSAASEEQIKSLDLRLLTKEGIYEWFEIQAHALKRFDGEKENVVYVGKITNIHKQKMEKERLKEEASTDTLTGLYNHKTAREIIKHSMKQQHGNSALIFADIDNFKYVNDNFGHSAGDEVLRTVGQQLKHSFRGTDILARIGGDEFIVYVREIGSIEVLEKRLNDLLVSIGGMNVDKNWEYKIYISIGVACYPNDAKTYPELFNKADKALYSSKDKGKNQITFYKNGLKSSEPMLS